MSTYSIVWSDSIMELTNQVNKILSNNGRVIGGLQVSHNGKCIRFYQAVLLELENTMEKKKEYIKIDINNTNYLNSLKSLNSINSINSATANKTPEALLKDFFQDV